MFKHFKEDSLSSLVLFLVALPLCLGIALASNAPILSGLIAGIIGGVIIGYLSNSQISVSGPAAGLAAIIVAGIAEVGSFPVFLSAVVIAGLLQIIFGFLKGGIVSQIVPTSVIKGMLVAIGIILILKQIPHALGFDADYEGDESFEQRDGHNTITEIYYAIKYSNLTAILISLFSIGIYLIWNGLKLNTKKGIKFIPVSLVIVVLGAIFYDVLTRFFNFNSAKLVELPSIKNMNEFGNFILFPDFSQLNKYQVWTLGLKIAIVASLETLLSIEAADKLDPHKRNTNKNRELFAQGVGNTLSGLIGGLPVTSVVVRTNANVVSGAQTKLSAILHGAWLLLGLLLIPGILNLIPLSSLAVILILVGLKLCSMSVFKEMYQRGWLQFLPFIITIVIIIFTDLLIGIMAGIVIGFIFTILSNFKSAVSCVNQNKNYLIRFKKDVTFLNKIQVEKILENVPIESYVMIDASNCKFIDWDIVEMINDFVQYAHDFNIKVEVKSNKYLVNLESKSLEINK